MAAFAESIRLSKKRTENSKLARARGSCGTSLRWPVLVAMGAAASRGLLASGRMLGMFCAGRDRFPASRGPAGLIHLASASQAERVCRNILGDDRTRANVGAIPYFDGSDQGRVTANKNVATDRRRVLGNPVVVAGDRSGSDIRVSADIRVAQVGEVHGLDALAQNAVLGSHEISQPRILHQTDRKAKVREWTGLGIRAQLAGVDIAVRLDQHAVVKRRIDEDAAGLNLAAGPDAGAAEQLHAGTED